MPTAAMHLLSVEDGIAVVTLNRPEALNSINRALRLELLDLFPALDERKDVKVIVITGAGDKAFCTGADLKERSQRSTEEMVHDRHYLTSKSTSALANVSKPVIAAIKGYCMAGGYEMVLQCDISIASDNAIFCAIAIASSMTLSSGTILLMRPSAFASCASQRRPVSISSFASW